MQMATTQAPQPTKRQVSRQGFVLEAIADRLSARRHASGRALAITMSLACVGTAFNVIFIVALRHSMHWSIDLPGVAALRLSAIAWAALLLWPLVSLWVRVIALVMTRHQLKRAVQLLVPGPVMTIQRPGIVLRHGDMMERLAWTDIREIRGRQASGVPGPELHIVRKNGSYFTVPFAVLNAMPGTIDSAIWAFSGQQFHVDMSRCETIW